MIFNDFVEYTKDLIQKNKITFVSSDMKSNVINELTDILKSDTKVQPWEDKIVEIHIGVYIPHYDYPIIPLDENDQPIVWKEDYSYLVDTMYTHRFLGYSDTHEKYSLKFIDSLSYFKNCVVKVDKFTDSIRSSWVLCSFIVSMIQMKTNNIDYSNSPVIVDYFEAKDHYKKDKSFEDEQKRLYMNWLSKWITNHGKNPETHMKNLKVVKKIKKSYAPVINNT